MENLSNIHRGMHLLLIPALQKKEQKLDDTRKQKRSYEEAPNIY